MNSTMGSRKFWTGLLLLTLLMPGAWAALSRADGATVLLNEMPVFTLKSPYKGAAPVKRAATAATNLQKMASVNPVEVKKHADGHQIFAGGKLLVVVSAAEAKAYGSTTAALATAWAQKLREALALPPVKVSRGSVDLTDGEVVVVTMMGSQAPQADVQAADEQIATAQRVPGGVRIVGKGFGETTVIVSAGGAVESIGVRVMPLAAHLPQTLEASVVGAPATRETVESAIEGAIRTRLQGQRLMQIEKLTLQAAPLAEGGRQIYTAQVSVSAPQAKSASGTVRVAVSNERVAYRSETELWYSNDPENVEGPGRLFYGVLQQDRPIRVLYHHLNVSYGGLAMRLEVVNTGDQPARILVIPGDSRPSPNPVFAGIEAANQFVAGWMSRSGEILTIPPGEAIPISMRRLAPRETTSGLCYLRLLSGPQQVVVRSEATPSQLLDDATARAQASSRPWLFMGPQKARIWREPQTDFSHLIFPNPFRKESIDYQVGGRYGFVRIGQRPIGNDSLGTKLLGNFGVLYEIDISAQNATAARADIELVFEASAGYSGALFVIDNELVRTPLLQPKAEYLLRDIRLEAGQRRQIQMVTVPLSGSSYPATLTLRPRTFARQER